MTPKNPFASLHAEAVATVQSYIREYHAGPIGTPERIQSKLDAILRSRTPDEAAARAKSAVQSALIAYLALWARGRIPGRITAQNVEQKVAKALSLADYLESIGETDQALKQRRRADRIRSLVEAEAA